MRETKTERERERERPTAEGEKSEIYIYISFDSISRVKFALPSRASWGNRDWIQDPS